MEVEEQRRRYDALLGMLHAEESARLKAEEKAAAVARDATASAWRPPRLPWTRTPRARAWRRGRLASAPWRTAPITAEIFARYEMDIDNLDQQCARLREEAFLAHVATQEDIGYGR